MTDKVSVHLMVTDGMRQRPIEEHDDICDLFGGAKLHSCLHKCFPGSLWSSCAAKTIANDNTEQSLLPAGGLGSLTLLPDYMCVGTMLRLRTRGFITCGEAQQSRMKLKLDGVTILDSLGTLPNNLTNFYIESCFDMTFYTVGVAGAVIGSGRTLIQTLQGVAHVQMRPLVMTTVANINTTLPVAVDQTYQWSEQLAGNSVTIIQANLRLLNCGT